MKRLVIGVTLLALFVLAPSVQAQSDPSFDSVQIQLWPEYDRPSMLVILTFQLSSDAALPAEFTARIPARAGEPNAVATLQGDQLVTSEYTRTVSGDWAEITVQAASPVVQLEYYDPALSQADQPREFQFSWEFDYPVDDLNVSVKQPLNATEMVILPPLGSAQLAADGLATYTASMGSLPAGETFTLELSYQKADNALAFQPPSPQTSGGDPSPAATGTPGEFPVWGWALVGSGALLLVVGVVYFIRSNQTGAAQSRYRQKKQSRPRPGGGVFCHQCGAKAGPGDKFCRECGTKLRL